MAFSDQDLINVGARFSTERMMEQIPVSVSAARKYEPLLATKFPAAKVDALEALGVRIFAGFTTQAQKKFEAYTGNVSVYEKMKATKDGVRLIITTADNAFEEEPEIRDQFHKGGPFGRSVASTIRKAETIIALAKQNSDALAEWGLSADEITAAETSLSELKNADTIQEKALTNLPPATAALYLDKGRAYMLLKQLSRTAKRLLSDQPAAADEFSIRILHRRGSRKTPETGASDTTA